jgi:hypothetical protein
MSLERGDHERSDQKTSSAAKDTSGVDVTLIRWMLSLTPAERLDVLQRHVDAVLEMRDRN